MVCFKVDKTVELVKEAMAADEQVVISLWQTGESRIADFLENQDKDDDDEDEDDDFYLGGGYNFGGGVAAGKAKAKAKGRAAPILIRGRGGAGAAGEGSDEDEEDEEAMLSGPKLSLEHALDTLFLTSDDVKDSLRRKRQLQERLKEFEDMLPPNALDHLIELCGGPGKVAEISGRTKRMTRDERTGDIRYELRTAVAADPAEEEVGVVEDRPSSKNPVLAGVAGSSSASSSSSRAAGGAASSSSSSNGGGGAGGANHDPLPGLGGATAVSTSSVFGGSSIPSLSKSEYQKRVGGRSGNLAKRKVQPGGGSFAGLNAGASGLAAFGGGPAAGAGLGAAARGQKVAGASASAQLNIREQELFQSGRKRVAVITEAGSTGISLHCERRSGRKIFRRRRMLSIELPWGADKAIQQFGRVHRSNQATPPKFQVVITPIQGEIRFVSSIARRMKLLGAVTKGDRFSSMGGVDDCLNDFDINNAYGKRALVSFLDDMRSAPSPEAQEAVYDKLDFWDADFHGEAKNVLENMGMIQAEGSRKWHAGDRDDFEESKSLNTFLNRLLMCSVKMQDSLFTIFSEIYDHLIQKDKDEGK